MAFVVVLLAITLVKELDAFPAIVLIRLFSACGALPCLLP
jgi:hypothetical protein